MLYGPSPPLTILTMTRKFAPPEVREEYIRSRDMPASQQRRYLEATGINRPSMAIGVFCRECQGWDLHAAKNCTVLGCPLWSFRPGTKGKGVQPDENVG